MAKKYIDAQKLKEEIQANLAAISFNDDYQEGYEACGMSVLKSIESFQQEQQDFPTTDEEAEKFLATHPKVEVPFKYKTPDWLFKKLEQEHTEEPDKHGIVTRQVPDKSLEDAAEEYATTHLRNNEFPTADCAFIAGAQWQAEQDKETIELAEDHAFLAGANWQKEQLLKDAVEGEAHPDDCEIWVNLVGYGYKFNDGDKVRIIVLPEED